MNDSQIKDIKKDIGNLIDPLAVIEDSINNTTEESDRVTNSIVDYIVEMMEEGAE